MYLDNLVLRVVAKVQVSRVVIERQTTWLPRDPRINDDLALGAVQSAALNARIGSLVRPIEIASVWIDN